ncbi:hypothetical protein ONZ45_g19720 [Pleurotus djamor]|nr:hypothetical protein ONZ45_g19720 [Pleurotus djamor]
MVFDDYSLDWIDIDNGIGQGDPISMILYLFYNADLLEIPVPEWGEDAIAYVDDASFIAVGKDFVVTHLRLEGMMERRKGGYEWLQTHNSRFETTKLRLIDFSPTPVENHPTLTLNDIDIQRESEYKLLGVTLDEHLRWKQQTATAVEKATKWVNALRRLSRVNGGISPSMLRRLYLAVAIPKMTYALDVWYTPPYTPPGGKKRQGSVRALKQLESVQRSAALAITGAMRTTASDITDVHAGLPSMKASLEFVCHRNVLRAASAGAGHPVREILEKAKSSNMIEAKDMEAIQPISSRKVDETCPIMINIPRDREASKKNEKRIVADHRIHVDGSGLDGEAAGAMVRYSAGLREVKASSMRLGPTTDHTTFDAEAVGLLLAAGEIQKERLTGNAAIFMDNKSVIQRLQTGQRGTGQYLLNSVENLLTKAKHQAREEGRNLSISLHWISAHDDVTGNERADELAKEAARGREHRPDPLPGTLREYFSLPLSKSAKKQFAKARRKHQSWDDWVKSKRKPKLDHIDEKLTDDNTSPSTSTYTA